MKFFLTLIFVLSCFLGFSQTFNVTYDNEWFDNYYELGNSVFCVNDTIHSFGYLTGSEGAYVGIQIIYDSEGNLIDTLIFDSPIDTALVGFSNLGGTDYNSDRKEFFNVLVEVDLYQTDSTKQSQNSIIVSDQNNNIQRIDHQIIDNWNYVFSGIRKYGDFFYAYGRAKLDTTTYFYDFTQGGFLMKLDTLGNQIWSRHYAQSAYVSYIDRNETGEFVLGGEDAITNSWPIGDQHLIIKTNEDGIEQWRYLYGGQGDQTAAPVIFLDNDRIISVGIDGVLETSSLLSSDLPLLFIELQDMGNFSQNVGVHEYIEKDLVRNNALTLKKDSNDFVYVGGSHYWNVEEGNPQLSLFGFLMKLNDDLDSLWVRRYSYYEGVYFAQKHIVRDMDFSEGNISLIGIAIEGSTGEPGNFPGLHHIWTLKVDSMGCLEPGCHLISGLEAITVGLQESMTVFPNPVQEEFTLKIDLPADAKTIQNSTLILMDMQGRTVQDWSLELVQQGLEKRNLSLPSNLNSGVYLLQWVQGNRWLDSVRLVKE